MVTLITARFIGNFLGEGIYDLHVSTWGAVNPSDGHNS